MKALVIGKGKSGTAAANVLRAEGAAVDFADGYDEVVVSPGVRVVSELQFGCERLRKRGTKLLAVTGSKGKSSVVKLVADAIGGVACGNYGLPVSEVGPCAWAVVEVSSFQMETTNLQPNTFEAAAILNLQEDHLDRHGSLAVYHDLKRRLVRAARIGFIGGETPIAADPALWHGSYFDNDVLSGNAAIAVELMRVAGLTGAQIASAFKAFEPLPHRMNVVATRDGVAYVDDSKATSIAALCAGVTMCKGPVRLIAGGLPKGDDPCAALPVLQARAKKIYLIGKCAEAFAASWQKAVDCEICGTMQQAVAAARREAVSGETVLLSPGTASFDQFSSFGERGEVFASLVQKERTDK